VIKKYSDNKRPKPAILDLAERPGITKEEVVVNVQ
jgi:hypothetical protein